MHLAFVFSAHALVSISLTLLNKALARSFPFPWLAVVLQCIGCVCITLIVNSWVKDLKPWNHAHLIDAIKLASLFVLCLSSSYYGLQRVHVSMVIVGKNFTPFVVTILECLIFGTSLSAKTVVGIFFSFVGSVLYSLNDNSLEATGLLLVVINAIIVALTCVCEKQIVVRKHQTPFGYSLYRNAFAVPVIAIPFCLQLEDPYAGITALQSSSWWVSFLIFVSSLFGTCAGLVLFELQSRVRATTTQMASLSYKLATTLLSLVFFPESRAAVGYLGWMGYMLSLCGVAIYALPVEKLLGLDSGTSSANQSGKAAKPTVQAPGSPLRCATESSGPFSPTSSFPGAKGTPASIRPVQKTQL